MGEENIMNRTTLGKLIVGTARGSQKVRIVYGAQLQALQRAFAARVMPKIEQIRRDHRRAFG
jgi:hypothetical protein